MDFMVGGRCCGKTTYMVKEVCTLIRNFPEEFVSIVVADSRRVDYWMDLLKERLTKEEMAQIIFVLPHNLHVLRGRRSHRFVDDADLVLATILGGYDLAIANGHLFSW